jgi:hypothetical protein
MDWNTARISPEQQGLLVGLVALQQANGIDFDTACGRVRSTLEGGDLIFKAATWPQIVEMMRWFATPPAPTG